MLYFLFKYAYYFTVDCIRVLTKMVIYTTVFEVPTHINTECINGQCPAKLGLWDYNFIKNCTLH